jgi:hypothetical protein
MKTAPKVPPLPHCCTKVVCTTCSPLAKRSPILSPTALAPAPANKIKDETGDQGQKWGVRLGRSWQYGGWRLPGCGARAKGEDVHRERGRVAGDRRSGGPTRQRATLDGAAATWPAMHTPRERGKFNCFACGSESSQQGMWQHCRQVNHSGRIAMDKTIQDIHTVPTPTSRVLARRPST